MRTLLAALSLLVTIAPAGAVASYSAHTRYASTAMTCAQIQSRIHDQGAVLLSYPSSPSIPGMTRFGRYVDGIRFCSKDELAAQMSVPASDTSSCHVKMCVDER